MILIVFIFIEFTWTTSLKIFPVSRSSKETSNSRFLSFDSFGLLRIFLLHVLQSAEQTVWVSVLAGCSSPGAGQGLPYSAQ